MQKEISLYRMDAEKAGNESGKGALSIYVIVDDNSQLEKALELYESQGYQVQFTLVAYSDAVMDMRQTTPDSARAVSVEIPWGTER